LPRVGSEKQKQGKRKEGKWKFQQIKKTNWLEKPKPPKDDELNKPKYCKDTLEKPTTKGG
jgi:hypothetical protein